MTKLRIASVPFVNARPLTWGFENGPSRARVEVLPIAPADIAGRILSGEVDAGLIPSIEFAAREGLEIIPDLGIAARGRVRSVLLVSRGPVESVRRIAVDRASRTSVALLKILLARRGLRGLVYDERPALLRDMLRDHDAALVIGDPALTAGTSGLEVLDLGEAWTEVTGLPFVFAFWAARSGAAPAGGAAPFLESLRLGLANIPAIAREAAPALGLPPHSIESYLKANVHYRIGPEEQRALDLFYRQAHELGLTSRCPSPGPIADPRPVPGPAPVLEAR